MFLKRENLAAAAIVSDDPCRTNLQNLLVTPDGGTVATDGKMILVVSPQQEVDHPNPGFFNQNPALLAETDEQFLFPNGISIPGEIANTILKTLRGRKVLALARLFWSTAPVEKDEARSAQIEALGDSALITFKDQNEEHPFPKWETMWGNASSNKRVEICLNAKLVIKLLTTMLKTTGVNEIITFSVPTGSAGGTGLILTGHNPHESIECAAILMPIKNYKHEKSPWLKKLFGESVPAKES